MLQRYFTVWFKLSLIVTIDAMILIGWFNRDMTEALMYVVAWIIGYTIGTVLAIGMLIFPFVSLHLIVMIIYTEWENRKPKPAPEPTEAQLFERML